METSKRAHRRKPDTAKVEDAEAQQMNAGCDRASALGLHTTAQLSTGPYACEHEAARTGLVADEVSGHAERGPRSVVLRPPLSARPPAAPGHGTAGRPGRRRSEP